MHRTNTNILPEPPVNAILAPSEPRRGRQGGSLKSNHPHHSIPTSALSARVAGPLPSAARSSSDIPLSMKLKPVKVKTPKPPATISRSAAREIIQLLAQELQLSPRVIFSTRLLNQRNACYHRPILVLLPATGLTEESVLHELAHVLDLESHRVKPHGPSFKTSAERVTELWQGASKP
jgi:hypothetical protein